MQRHKIILSWLTVFMVMFSLGWFVNSSLANDNESTYLKIDKGLFYLKEVFETVSRNYVEELDPEVLSKSAIEGMLKEFDPYTVFFEDPGSHQMRMITRGKYGGVGMEIGFQNQQVTVIAPMEGTPAQRAGVRAGDVILKIDGTPIQDLSLEETSQRLRGKIGTSVTIEIERPGLDTPVKLELIREEIVIKDVSYADFIEPGTAYIRLSAFSDKAGQELKEAVQQLQAREKIQRVILDLRGNPGGLLTAAVEVANVFLPPGQLVVSTRGSHESENKFFTKEAPLLPTVPLVVLVNESSASASEIVAGAIQDLDRGVLVGSETFGKGLVQKVYPIDRVSQAYLKITTAKYYVPSGRSIQKEDYKKNTRVFTNLADSVEYDQSTDYFTHNGRIVHGGGGIHPDVEVAEADLSVYLRNLTGRGLLFQFAVDYLSSHPALKQAPSVTISEQILDDFRAYLDRQQFDFEIEGEAQLKQFQAIARDQQYHADIRDLAEVTLQKLAVLKARKFDEHRERIRHLLEAEFAEKLDGPAARIRSMLSHDEQLQQSLIVLQNLSQYQEILAIRK